MKKFLPFSIILLLVGCMKTVQMYSGDLPKSGIAELVVPNFISVREFDGIANAHRMSGGDLRWKSTTSKILPGRHYIVVRYSAVAIDSAVSDDIKIEFDALPGGKYQLKYEWGPVISETRDFRSRTTTRSFRAWIEDAGNIW